MSCWRCVKGREGESDVPASVEGVRPKQGHRRSSFLIFRFKPEEERGIESVRAKESEAKEKSALYESGKRSSVAAKKVGARLFIEGASGGGAASSGEIRNPVNRRRSDLIRFSSSTKTKAVGHSTVKTTSDEKKVSDQLNVNTRIVNVPRRQSVAPMAPRGLPVTPRSRGRILKKVFSMAS